MSETPPAPEPPNTTAAVLVWAVKSFGKDVTIALIFAAILALAGRQIYRDLIVAQNSTLSVAKERAEQDKHLTAALHDLTKEVHTTNRMLEGKVVGELLDPPSKPEPDEILPEPPK